MRWTGQIRQDIKTLKGLEKNRRLEFVWDYYKLPLIVLLSVAALAVLTVALNAGRSNAAVYAVLVNADDSGDSAVLTGLLEQTGEDMQGRTVDVSAGYTLRYDSYTSADGETVQVLAALFGIGDLDLFAADEAVFASYASQEAFVDLSLFIEQEDLANHALYTYEGQGGREVVAGIWLKPGSPLHRAGYYTGDVIIGVAANAQNLDPAVAWMKELVKQN